MTLLPNLSPLHNRYPLPVAFNIFSVFFKASSLEVSVFTCDLLKALPVSTHHLVRKSKSWCLRLLVCGTLLKFCLSFILVCKKLLCNLVAWNTILFCDWRIWRSLAGFFFSKPHGVNVGWLGLENSLYRLLSYSHVWHLGWDASSWCWELNLGYWKECLHVFSPYVLTFSWHLWLVPKGIETVSKHF